MQIKIVRHDRGSDDPDGNIQGCTTRQGGYQSLADFPQTWLGQEDFNKKGYPDHGNQAQDKYFQPAHTQSLEKQEQKGIERRYSHPVNQGKSGEQLNANGHPQHFSQVAGRYGDLCQDIKTEIDGPGICFPVGLCQVPSPDDAQTGRHAL